MTLVESKELKDKQTNVGWGHIKRVGCGAGKARNEGLCVVAVECDLSWLA